MAALAVLCLANPVFAASLTTNFVGNSVGLGVEVEVMANTRAGVSLDRYDIDSESIHVDSAGLSYRFK